MENKKKIYYSSSTVAGIAQLVEHLIRNEGVVGSSPITGTRNKNPQTGIFLNINYVFKYYFILLLKLSTKTASVCCVCCLNISFSLFTNKLCIFLMNSTSLKVSFNTLF